MHTWFIELKFGPRETAAINTRTATVAQKTRAVRVKQSEKMEWSRFNGFPGRWSP